jgi:hypothetical protein
LGDAAVVTRNSLSRFVLRRQNLANGEHTEHRYGQKQRLGLV